MIHRLIANAENSSRLELLIYEFRFFKNIVISQITGLLKLQMINGCLELDDYFQNLFFYFKEVLKQHFLSLQNIVLMIVLMSTINICWIKFIKFVGGWIQIDGHLEL